MAISDDPLWKTLSEFQIGDSDADLSFSSRLAAENGWSQMYADRVVEEYRRFLYLAMRSKHAVTPSDQVDQAWHLHLAYTQSYWNDLCDQILGKPLHHDPTHGGPDQRAHFHEQYERALTAYREKFGKAPPMDIWPPAQVRFSQQFRRINISKSLVIPRTNVLKSKIIWALICMGIIVGTMHLAYTQGTAARAAIGDNSPSLIVPLAVMASLGAAIGLVFLGYRWVENFNDGFDGGGCGGGGCGGG